MAFKVEHHYNQYKISVGDGRPVLANSIDEVALCLFHYYDLSKHLLNDSHCPFCRDIMQRARRDRK